MGKFDEKRRHKRVQLEGLGASISGLSVELVGFGPISLCDISYGGAAFLQPEQTPINFKGQNIELIFNISGKKVIEVPSKTLRVGPQMFAVEFLDTSLQTRNFVDGLITNRMIGLNMNLIDPLFYRERGEFNYWFHGPKNTNMYLWDSGEGLVRATLDMVHVALHWGPQGFQIDNKMEKVAAGGVAVQGAVLSEGAFRQAAEILSQMRTNVECLKQFQEQVFQRVLA